MIIEQGTLTELQPDEARYTLVDEMTPGFTVEVRPCGEVRLFDVYTFEGKKVRTLLGVYPDVDVEVARRSVIERRERTSRVAAAQRKAHQRSYRRSAGASLEEMIDTYKRAHVAGLSEHSQTQYSQMLNLVAGHYMDLPAIQPATVRTYMDAMGGTPVKANRYLAVLSSFCRFLVERGHLQYNPAACISRYKERPAIKTMSEADLTALGRALVDSKAVEDTKLAIRVMLCTGVRVGECTGMTYGELGQLKDGGLYEWNLPGSRTKNGRDFLCYLPTSELCHEFLGRYEKRRATKSELVFRSNAGTVRQAMKRMCDAVGIDHYSPHDLRRTVGTLLAREGYNPDLRGVFLNHAKAGVTDRHYNQYDYATEKAEMALVIHEIMRKTGVLV